MTDPEYTSELLRAYSDAALKNSAELHTEATLLLANRHWARAYFLGLASIEEIGKALLTFDSQNRNLTNPAVVTKLKVNMGSHSQKICYAFRAAIVQSSNQREAIQSAIDLMVSLKRGREPSMYSDLVGNPDRVQMPRDVVRQKAATDCVRLAADCAAHARYYIRNAAPPSIAPLEDQLFTMKSKTFDSILRNPDFWEYFLDCYRRDEKTWSKIVVDYQRDYSSKQLTFKREPAV